MVRIAVAGAGASGVLLVCNLRRAMPSAAIRLIEIVAIPDIRVQCAELAGRIAARVPATSQP